MFNILFLSNGSGEDTVSAAIIKELKNRNINCRLTAFPLVGRGDVFLHNNIEVAGPLMEMPSGGLINNNLSAIMNDLKSGLMTLTLRQIKYLRSSYKLYDLIVCVGDRVPFIFASLFTNCPIVFVGIAQSVKVHGYSFFEKWLLRRRCEFIFTRDRETAENLQHDKIRGDFFGNPMMDTFSMEGPDNFPAGKNILALLPGSRSEVFYNLKMCLSVCREVKKSNFEIIFLMALSPSVESEDVLKKSLPDGWIYESETDTSLGYLKHTDGTFIEFTRKYFGWVINNSHVVLGLAGTGNEQAGGLGKPVVTFWSGERQVKKAFMRHQKKLLGDSLIIVSPEPHIISEEILKLFSNHSLREKLGEDGKNNMGERGGISRITDYIINKIANNSLKLSV